MEILQTICLIILGFTIILDMYNNNDDNDNGGN